MAEFADVYAPVTEEHPPLVLVSPLVINKGNNHETHDNGFGGSACTLKHVRAGTEQQWRYVRKFEPGRFHDAGHDDRLIHKWKWDGESTGLDGRQGPSHQQLAQRHHESVRQHARAQRLAQRIDVDADRTGFRRRPITSVANEKPRLVRGFLLVLCVSRHSGVRARSPHRHHAAECGR